MENINDILTVLVTPVEFTIADLLLKLVDD